MPNKNNNKKVGRKPKLRRRGGEESKSATHLQGRTAQRDMRFRLPLMTKASHRATIPYYEMKVERAGTVGAITNYFFIANGCYDPNITGTGHQPMGFDTMMQYYEQFCVVRSKCTATFVNNSTNVITVGLALTPDTTNAIIGDNVENGLIVYRTIDGPSGSGYQGVGNRIAVLDLSCDCASYFGRRSEREMLDDPTLNGSASANPTEGVYFDVQTWDSHFVSSANSDVFVSVLIEYDVIFWEPRKVAQQLEEKGFSMVKPQAAVTQLVRPAARKYIPLR